MVIRKQTLSPKDPELWDHQKRVLELMDSRTYFAIFHDMGCGKTRTTVSCLRAKMNAEKRALHTLVLSPLSVVPNWVEEFRRHGGKVAAGVQALTGTEKERIEQTKAPGKFIFVTNIDAITSCPDLWKILASSKWDAIVVDESQRFKNPRAKRLTGRSQKLTTAEKAKGKKPRQRIIGLAEVCDRTKYKFILSGDPTPQDERDLWGQFRLLDSGICGSNFTAFQTRHFYDANQGNPWKKWPDIKMKPESRRFFDTILSTHSDRVTKDECLDLPPLIRVTRHIELTPEIRRHYVEMERDFLTELDNAQVVTADIVVTKLLRLQQICCGILKDTTGTVTIQPTNKLHDLSELLEDLCPRHKVIVWCNFRDSITQIDALCADLGLYNVVIQGGQSAPQRQAAIKEFKEDPKVSVCVANPAAGGVGIDGLQGASYMIYYSKGYNLEHDRQSEARAYRAGSEIHEKITRIDLVTAGTVEEEITEALRAKKTIGDMLFAFKGRGKAAA